MRDLVEIKVSAVASGFAEDKDAAKELRREVIMPALLANKVVVLDFVGVTSSTQSFVHALVGEPLQKIGESVLERLEFRSCAPQVRSLVELVVDYSLGGFSRESSVPVDVKTARRRSGEQTSAKSRPKRR